MTTVELWLIGGLVFLIMAVGGGWWWIARDWQRSRQQRLRPRDAPPIGIPSPGPRDNRTDPVALPPRERIRWGDTAAWPDLSEDIPPETGDEREQCPICHHKLSVQQVDVYRCPDCQTLYHQRCWRKFDRVCRICPKPQT